MRALSIIMFPLHWVIIINNFLHYHNGPGVYGSPAMYKCSFPGLQPCGVSSQAPAFGRGEWLSRSHLHSTDYHHFHPNVTQMALRPLLLSMVVVVLLVALVGARVSLGFLPSTPLHFSFVILATHVSPYRRAKLNSLHLDSRRCGSSSLTFAESTNHGKASITFSNPT